MKKTVLCIIVIIALSITLGVSVCADAVSQPLRYTRDSSAFSDVHHNHWAYKEIRRLAAANIVAGYIDGTFEPDTKVERQELAVMLCRLAELKAAQNDGIQQWEAEQDQGAKLLFRDVAADMWSYSYILNSLPYLGGYRIQGGALDYMPENACLRGEITAAIVKLCGLELKSANTALLDSFSDKEMFTARDRMYGALALQNGIINGFEDSTLRMNEPATRAEACVMIVRAIEKTGFITFPEEELLYVPNIDSGYYESFFNDAVFVGDSITQGLRNYVLNQRIKGTPVLGNARFLAATSYSLRVSASAFSSKTVNLTYQGSNMSIEDCMAAMGAKEVYIMLGMNDLTFAQVSVCKENYKKTIEKILKKTPEIRIYIQLCSPITKSGEKVNLNNSNMDLFNSALKELCGEYGLEWVDVNTPLKGEDNCLQREYSSDNYVHMSNTGCVVWVNALRDFARQRYLLGEWEAPGLHALDFEGEYY